MLVAYLVQTLIFLLFYKLDFLKFLKFFEEAMVAQCVYIIAWKELSEEREWVWVSESERVSVCQPWESYTTPQKQKTKNKITKRTEWKKKEEKKKRRRKKKKKLTRLVSLINNFLFLAFRPWARCCCCCWWWCFLSRLVRTLIHVDRWLDHPMCHVWCTLPRHLTYDREV